MHQDDAAGWSCPVTAPADGTVQLGHGGGGRLSARLIRDLFLRTLGDQALDAGHDGAVLDLGAGACAFTTDSYVVRPLFFPGGDIGTLAVNGTVNDLAMCGAQPLYLSAGFILEEGLPMETLERVVCSMQQAAAAAGVRLVTGDTKVVDRGKGDGVFINTAGLGRVAPGVEIHPRQVQPGDHIVLSGDIGRHGVAVMAARDDLGLETTIESDCAPLAGAVQALMQAGVALHCLRDLTRGGLASALVEIAQTSGRGLMVNERSIPVCDPVLAACELLGLDPLYVANEGRFVAFVPAAHAQPALETLRRHASGGATVIGEVSAATDGRVRLHTDIGGTRMVDLLSGEQLPRIC
jgi:hydrogenase expression/formation protein HypE